MNIFAAYYDNNIRNESSSGGLFSLIAKSFDVVYGVAMTKDCYSSEYVRVENDYSTIRGSKYLQATVGDTYKQVLVDLVNGKTVLFTGTGCQINGLALFLGKDYSNLMLMDIVCHGTPSPKLWREYVMHQEKIYGKLLSVNFRFKNNLSNVKTVANNKLCISKDKDVFMNFFLKNLCLRPSCYNCHAKKFRKSDITIADFWGIDDVAPEMNDGKGISAVFVRTKKGQSLFEKIKDNIIWKEVHYEDAVHSNPCEYKSVERPLSRDSFFYDLQKLSIDKMIKKYITPPLWKIMGRRVKRCIFISCSNCDNNMKNRIENYYVLYEFKGDL